MKKLHLWPESPTVTDDSVILSFTLEKPNQSREKIWYRLPVEYRDQLIDSCDSFVVGAIFKAMRSSWDFVIHGQVSPKLLKNLSEYQAIWQCWCPERYQSVEIEAEVEQELSLLTPRDRTLAPFSGGVDSSFTLLRHQKQDYSRWQNKISAGLMVHGFDIPLSEPEKFDKAVIKSQYMLDSLGVDLIAMATNVRSLGQNWNHCFVTAIVSCLMLFQKNFRVGLIPSGEPYQSLPVPYGSHPLLNRFLSSETFEVVHDGANFTRLQKIQQLSQWPEALKSLRVCWEGAEKDRNCGRCEKCIRTMLGFRALGLPLPPCFEKDVTNQQILNLAIKRLNNIQVNELQLILITAQENNFDDSWTRLLQSVVLAQKIQHFLITPAIELKLKDFINKPNFKR